MANKEIFLRIVDEKSSPFVHASPIGRYYLLNAFCDRESSDSVCDDFWKSFSKVFDGLKGKKCLEIGDGGRIRLMHSLRRLGAKIEGLDGEYGAIPQKRRAEYKLDKNGERTDIGDSEGKKVAETFKFNAWSGDVEKSLENPLLRNSQYDLVYFWGSMFSHLLGSTAGPNHSIEYNLMGTKEKILDKIRHVPLHMKDGGILFTAASHFAENCSRFFPINVARNILDNLYVAMAWSEYKAPKQITLIGSSKENALDLFSKINEITYRQVGAILNEHPKALRKDIINFLNGNGSLELDDEGPVDITDFLEIPHGAPYRKASDKMERAMAKCICPEGFEMTRFDYLPTASNIYLNYLPKVIKQLSTESIRKMQAKSLYELQRKYRSEHFTIKELSRLAKKTGLEGICDNFPLGTLDIVALEY